MKEDIYAAIRGDLGERILPKVGVGVDDIYTVISCPICGHKTLDNYDICRHCGWEYDGALGDRYSTANKATPNEYKMEYMRILRLVNYEKE